jgi:hypothetical protein
MNDKVKLVLAIILLPTTIFMLFYDEIVPSIGVPVEEDWAQAYANADGFYYQTNSEINSVFNTNIIEDNVFLGANIETSTSFEMMKDDLGNPTNAVFTVYFENHEADYRAIDEFKDLMYEQSFILIDELQSVESDDPFTIIINMRFSTGSNTSSYSIHYSSSSDTFSLIVDYYRPNIEMEAAVYEVAPQFEDLLSENWYASDCHIFISTGADMTSLHYNLGSEEVLYDIFLQNSSTANSAVTFIYLDDYIDLDLVSLD